MELLFLFTNNNLFVLARLILIIDYLLNILNKDNFLCHNEQTLGKKVPLQYTGCSKCTTRYALGYLRNGKRSGVSSIRNVVFAPISPLQSFLRFWSEFLFFHYDPGFNAEFVSYGNIRNNIRAILMNGKFEKLEDI